MRLSPPLTERKIAPGDFAVTDGEETLVTVLGSCVAACIRDVARGTIAMNHFMLPGTAGDLHRAAVAVSDAARFGAHAMDLIINELVKRGAARRDLEAKLFGGAALLRAAGGQIGSRNGRFALEYLEAEGIRVAAADLGGRFPRKIYFSRREGRVLVKYLRRQYGETIAQRERDYGRSIRGGASDANVEFFQ